MSHKIISVFPQSSPSRADRIIKIAFWRVVSFKKESCFPMFFFGLTFSFSFSVLLCSLFRLMTLQLSHACSAPSQIKAERESGSRVSSSDHFQQSSKCLFKNFTKVSPVNVIEISLVKKVHLLILESEVSA